MKSKWRSILVGFVGLFLASMLCSLFDIPFGPSARRRSNQQRAVETLTQVNARLAAQGEMKTAVKEATEEVALGANADAAVERLQQKFANSPIKRSPSETGDMKELMRIVADNTVISSNFMAKLTAIRLEKVQSCVDGESGALGVPGDLKQGLLDLMCATNAYAAAHLAVKKDLHALYARIDPILKRHGKGRENPLGATVTYCDEFFGLYCREAEAMSGYYQLLLDNVDSWTLGKRSAIANDRDFLKKLYAAAARLDDAGKAIMNQYAALPGVERFSSREELQYPEHILEYSVREENERNIPSLFGIQTGMLCTCRGAERFMTELIVGTNRFPLTITAGVTRSYVQEKEKLDVKLSKAFFGVDTATVIKDPVAQYVTGVSLAIIGEDRVAREVVDMMERKFCISMDEKQIANGKRWEYMMATNCKCLSVTCKREPLSEEQVRMGRRYSAAKILNEKYRVSSVYVELLDVGALRKAEKCRKAIEEAAEKIKKKESFDAL